MMMVDFARVIAMVFMIQDHTMDALLSPSYLHGPAFQVWLFIRGLTAPIFLTLSGISFTLATISRWDLHSHLDCGCVHTSAAIFVLYIAGLRDALTGAVPARDASSRYSRLAKLAASRRAAVYRDHTHHFAASGAGGSTFLSGMAGLQQYWARPS